MYTHPEPQGVTPVERRQHFHLRGIYSDARSRIDHFFHDSHDWAGSSIDYLAHRLIHEAYPQLSSSEVKVLVSAIERGHHAAAEGTLIKGFALAPE